MTEDEAKTKWCPMVRHESPEDEGNGTWNRGRKDDVINIERPNYSCACIASACMMWRWEVAEEWTHPHTGEKYPTAFSTEHGYCGLGGKP
jgi:hypothetical protein